MPGPHFVSAAAYSCRFQSEPDITMMTPLHLTNFRVVGCWRRGPDDCARARAGKRV